MERLAKFWSLQLTAVIILSIICVAIILLCAKLYIFINSIINKNDDDKDKKSLGGLLDAFTGAMIGVIICIPIIISGEMMVLSAYEKWRGCLQK